MTQKRQGDKEAQKRSAPAPASMPRLTLGGLIAASLCATWALFPLPTSLEEQDRSPATLAPTAEAPSPLDLAAFSAPIWYAPPPEPVVQAPRPEPPPPPFDWQLIAIVTDQGRLGAVFYDRSQDALVQVFTGESVGRDRIVAAIEPAAVSIHDHGHVRTIALDGGPKP